MAAIRVSVFFPVILVAAVEGFPSSSLDTNDEVRIVGGVQVQKNELPYQISLQSSGRHFCGGAIYNANYIITAAHCTTTGANPSSLRVVAGEHNIDSISDDGTEQERTVLKITRHPGYIERTFENDIAILKLSLPLELNKEVAAIPLPEAGSTVTGLGLVSGWGRTIENGPSASILRKVSVPIITDEKCRASYGASVLDNMICAGFDLGGKDACQGDSGGPLTVGTGANRVLAGVVSWGAGCARPNAPGVYTEVSKFITFINNNTPA